MEDLSALNHRGAFTLLLEKGLGVQVVQAEWCPTMDLIAVLDQDGELHVYRLNWQRLWAITMEFISAICWRPDGRQLAVGLLDGQVLLLNTENGEIIGKHQVFEERAVSAIHWTYAKEDQPTNHVYFDGRRVEVLFEPPESDGVVATSGGSVHHSNVSTTTSGLEGFSDRFKMDLNKNNAAWPLRPTSLSLIACMSGKGEVALYNDGLFPLMKTNGVFVDKDDWEIEVLRLKVAPDLKSLSILWTEQDASNLCLEQLNLSTVGDSAELLHNLSTLGADVLKSLQRCEDLCASLSTHWASVSSAMQEFKDSLQSLLNQHSVYTTPQSDLLLLVTMGEYTSAMEQFLVSTMGETGIKKVARTVDGAFCSMLNVLIDHLIPEMERMAFRLGELRTFSYLSLAHDNIYLRSGEVGAAERKALHCFVHLEHLRDATTTVASQYRIFFAWLVTALRRFPEDTVDTLMGYPLSHVDEIRNFLHTEFMVDSIPRLLNHGGQDEGSLGARQMPEASDLDGDYDCEKDREQESQQWLSDVLDCLEQCVNHDMSKPDMHVGCTVDQIPKVDSKSMLNQGLMAHLQDLQCCVLKALDRPCASISARILMCDDASKVAVKRWPLKPQSISDPNSRSATVASLHYNSHGDVSVAYAIDTATESHVVVASSRKEDDSFTVSALTLPESLRVIDIRPYKEDSWVVLSESVQGSAERCGTVLHHIPGSLFDEGSFNSHVSMRDFTSPTGFTRATISDLIASSLGATRLDIDRCRQRRLPYDGCRQPLAVSSSRGTAFVLNGSQRMILFDLEEDEEGEVDWDGEDDEVGEDEDEMARGEGGREMVDEHEEPVTPR